MRRGPGADADDELIGRIRRSSLLLNTHLRDMLTLAKGEAGRLEMRHFGEEGAAGEGAFVQGGEAGVFMFDRANVVDPADEGSEEQGNADKHEDIRRRQRRFTAPVVIGQKK